METEPIGSSADSSPAPYLIEQWKLIVQVQMHFNDMILKTRTLGVSVVIAVYGAAAVTVAHYPSQYLTLPFISEAQHISIVVILFGLMLLVSIAVIDVCYYYRLLLAAVARGTAIERDLENTCLVPPNLTSFISSMVSPRRAHLSLAVMYGIPFASGLAFFAYVYCVYIPPPIVC